MDAIKYLLDENVNPRPYRVMDYAKRGLKAVYYSVIHETAHALQHEVRGGRVRGSVHNQVWRAKVRELLVAASHSPSLWITSQNRGWELC